MYTLHEQWKTFFRDKEQAEEDLTEEFKKRQAELDRMQKALTKEKNKAFKEFRDEWAKKKEEVQHARDEEIINRLMQGDSQASLMKELGTSNTILFSNLAKVARERQAAGVRPEPAAPWLWHSHSGVHGWLLSQDGTRFKMYDPAFDPEDDEGEPEYFIGDINGGYVSGSKELYLRTSPLTIAKRLDMLRQLVEGTYEGKIVEQANPYTA